MNKLYDDNALEIMKIADNTSDMSLNRIEQIRSFALAANYKSIGIANCFTFPREVAIIKQYLSKDFKVYTVDCKYGRIRKQDLLGGSSSHILCNPAGQAQYLNDKKTDLNISLGLCVGHDMIFNEKSLAPVTSIFTKDFTNNNNPAQAVAAISRSL